MLALHRNRLIELADELASTFYTNEGDGCKPSPDSLLVPEGERAAHKEQARSMIRQIVLDGSRYVDPNPYKNPYRLPDSMPMIIEQVELVVRHAKDCYGNGIR